MVDATRGVVSRKSGYRVVLAELGAAQKSGAGVPAYLRWVNRGLGRRAAAVAYLCGLTPNAVTLASSLLSAAGLVLLAVATPGFAVGAGVSLLLLAGYALDSADGQLARLTRSGSKQGEFLDHLVDAVRQPAVHLATAVSLAHRADLDGQWPVLVALGFMLVSSAWFFGQILAESLFPSPRTRPGADAPVWVSFVKVPYDVGFLYLIFFLLGSVAGFVGLYTALFGLTTAVAVASMVRKYHALAHAG